jgi:hypothetical protein
MQEIWKDIEGYEGLYQVSNLGNVKSLRRLKPNTPNAFIPEKVLEISGGGAVSLCKGSVREKVHVSKLVATLFVLNPNKYEHIIFKNI